MTLRLLPLSRLFSLRRHRGYHCNRKSLLALGFGVALGFNALPAADMVKSNFESSIPDYNPWAGVTDTGLIKVLPGRQPAVNDEGRTYNPDFGPSVAVGDLTGDGLPDLVIADSHGFFWFFVNSGTPGHPKFTHGEVMPIWLGFTAGDPSFVGKGGEDNVIPNIQLIDLGGDGKLLSLIAGNYVGRLFYIPNRGTAATPAFPMPKNRADLMVATRTNPDAPTGRDGMLWTNFISPFLYDWWGSGNLDLILGDGSYAANSIYLLTNKGTRDRPVFNQDNTIKIIPGLGKEHLTPQVVDWNNDGKPDIIAGERTGKLDLFLNTTTDPKQPTFDAGQTVRLGSKDNFGEFLTVDVNDLPGNKLPNLILTNSKGDIVYAQNTGTPGQPRFGDPVPLRGINPFPKILRPIGWHLESPHGVPHELLVCTNASVQPGFTPPQDTSFKNALRYYVYPIKNQWFNDFYYPKDEGPDPHRIIYDTGFQIREDVTYKISCWVRTIGIGDLSWHVRGWARLADDPIEEVHMSGPVGSGSGWSHFEDTFQFRLKNTKTRNNLVGVGLEFNFHGQGEIYFDDVTISASTDNN